MNGDKGRKYHAETSIVLLDNSFDSNHSDCDHGSRAEPNQQEVESTPWDRQRNANSRTPVAGACTAGLSVARTFRLLVTGSDGRDGQVLGETTEVLSLCRGKQTIRIPVSLPITLTNQRLQLIISSAVSANVNLQMGAGTFLEATRFVGTP